MLSDYNPVTRIISMNLKEILNELTERYNEPGFIANDPIQFPRRFSRLQDIEISALLTSILAWGRRDMILRNADRLHAQMQNQPYHFVMNREWERLADSGKNIHRTIFEKDVWQICRRLYAFYTANDTLESLFSLGVLDGIDRLSCLLSSRHLSSPLSQSPCKRTNMMLRWLVRNDGIVDIGIWNTIGPSQLIIPLDTHVGRVSRMIWPQLPKTDKMKAAQQITGYLAELCPEDPCRYDFALFGYGQSERADTLFRI